MDLSILAIAAFLTFSFQEPAPETALASLVDAERAFAKMSETIGMRSAFSANLGEGSIVLQPAPVDGRKAHQDSPEVPGMLQWKPIFADVSSGGDLGYTTGPWVFRGSATDPPIYGHYVTVWKKQKDGLWKVMLDGGISHPKPAENGGEGAFSSPQDAGATAAETAPPDDLLESDRKLSRASAKEGFSAALLAKAGADARLYRPGSYPRIGLPAIREALAGEPESWVWEPSGGDTARSGDLGYTFGIARAAEGAENPTPGAANAYLRIWKRDSKGEWRVVLDLANPLPASKE